MRREDAQFSGEIYLKQKKKKKITQKKKKNSPRQLRRVIQQKIFSSVRINRDG